MFNQFNGFIMKTMASLAASAAILAGGYSATAGEWKEDASHSTIGFSAKHMVISNVNGKFNDYSINVKSDKPDFSDAKIDVRIKATSINTENDRRDNHLRNDDFFAADKFPEISFVSSSMKKLKGNKYKVTGNLTMRGITKQVTFDAELGGVVKDPWGNHRAGFTLTGSINRFDYGLKWNDMIEAGGLVVGETIKIACEVELLKKS
ncbi:YceI family protein [Ignavibacteria bacterium]